ncbi:MAG TPA: cytochrome P450 [Anaerolineales bacterium]|nr:cytochrome P450 [Anaerolineales bacterium]
MTAPAPRPTPPDQSSTKRLPPTPSGASLRQLVRHPLDFFGSLTAQYGDIVCYRPAPDPAYLLNHPDYIRHVLVDNNRNYTKATYSNMVFNKVIGEGLLTSEGEVWRKQRRMMQPAFHHTRLAQLDEMITQATEAMLAQWQALYAAGQPIDLPREMSALTLTVTTRALFGVDLGDEVREVGEIVNRAASFLEKPSNPRLIESAAELSALVDRIIQQRKRDFRDAGDLLSSLIMARDEHTGAAMGDEQLRSQIMTLMLAGYETTASALTWTWYLLSKHPWAMERVRSEARRALQGRAPRYADLEQLPYIRMALNESLRLFPPAWTLGRRALAEDQIGGYTVAPGTVIAVCIYTLHRHPAFWEDAEQFDPERFSPDRSAGRHKFAYVPFGAGPRQCIGNNFGVMEACLIIACIAQRFEMRLMPGVEAEPQALFVLRPGRDLLMSLHP